MARIGSDWLFVGLGLGALYLVYKSTKPVTDSLGSVSSVVGTASNLANDVLGSVQNVVDRIASPSSYLSTPTGFSATGASMPNFTSEVTKAVLSGLPGAGAVTAATGLYSAGKSVFSNYAASKPTKTSNNYANYSPVANPKDVQQKTILASAQGVVSVAPPQMSVSPSAKISPFTGKPFLPKK